MSTGSPVPARVAAGAIRSSWGGALWGTGREACQPSRQALLGCLAWLWVWFSQNTKPTRQGLIPRHRALCPARRALTQDTLARKEAGLVAGPQCPQLGPAGGDMGLGWGWGCLQKFHGQQLFGNSHGSKGSQHLRPPLRLTSRRRLLLWAWSEQRFCW